MRTALRTALRPELRKALKGDEMGRIKAKLEQPKSNARAKAEHCFHVVKCLSRHRKRQYRGWLKTSAAFSLFALANFVWRADPSSPSTFGATDDQELYA